MRRLPHDRRTRRHRRTGRRTTVRAERCGARPGRHASAGRQPAEPSPRRAGRRSHPLDPRPRCRTAHLRRLPCRPRCRPRRSAPRHVGLGVRRLDRPRRDADPDRTVAPGCARRGRPRPGRPVQHRRPGPDGDGCDRCCRHVVRPRRERGATGHAGVGRTGGRRGGSCLVGDPGPAPAHDQRQRGHHVAAPQLRRRARAQLVGLRALEGPRVVGSGVLRGTGREEPPPDPVGRAGALRHPPRGPRGVRDLVVAPFDRLGLPTGRARRQPRGGTSRRIPRRGSRLGSDARRWRPGRSGGHGGGHRRRGPAPARHVGRLRLHRLPRVVARPTPSAEVDRVVDGARRDRRRRLRPEDQRRPVRCRRQRVDGSRPARRPRVRPEEGSLMLEAVLTGAVAGGTSILFPVVGETFTERSGVINLGTEGSMLAGALAASIVGMESGGVWLGALAGAVAGAALALVHAFMVLTRGANQIATGLVVTFLGIGLTALFGQDYVGQGVNAFAAVPIPVLSDIPFIGPILFNHDPLTYIAIISGPLAWLVLFRTRFGLMVRAAGERPEVLVAYGMSATQIRYLATVLGGSLAGIGGAQLSTAFTLNWSENMTVGRGFVAVSLVIFAAWDPLKAIIGAYLFSGAIALQLQLQARGTDVSQYLLQAVPYLTVIVILAALSRHRAHDAPESLSRVF